MRVVAVLFLLCLFGCASSPEYSPEQMAHDRAVSFSQWWEKKL